MKALLCRAYGPPESLIVEEAPGPEPEPGDVVIAVKAASVNFPDVLIIDNKYHGRTSGVGQSRCDPVMAAAANGNLRSITPFFIVKDLQASISHYIERFGFQLEFQGPPDGLYYAQVSRDGIAIMLKKISRDVLPCPNHTQHEWARWDAYVYTLDPDALFDEFKQRGASFVKELSFIDDGLWGFEVTDADGYVLAFFRTRDE